MTKRKASSPARPGLATTSATMRAVRRRRATAPSTLKMVESLTNPAAPHAEEAHRATSRRRTPRSRSISISPPTDQADQKIQQMLQSGDGRRRARGARHHRRAVLDQRLALRHGAGPRRAGRAGRPSPSNAAEVRQHGGKTYYRALRLLRPQPVLPHRPGRGGRASRRPGQLGRAARAGQGDPGPGRKHQYGYAFRGGTNGDGNAIAVIEAYVADDIDHDNAFKLTNGNTIFSAPRRSTRMKPTSSCSRQASPPSSVAWGYPEMVRGLLQRLHRLPAAGPRGHRHRQAVEGDQGGPVDHGSPARSVPSGKAVQPLATAGWGIAEGSKHKAEAVEADQVPAPGRRLDHLHQGEQPGPDPQGRRARTRSTRPGRGRAT